jgi:hypothetical protein
LNSAVTPAASSYAHLDGLDQIGAQQQVIARAQSLGDRAQELRCSRRREVADRAAEKCDEPAVAVGEHVEVALVVGDQGMDLEPGIALEQLLAARP